MIVYTSLIKAGLDKETVLRDIVDTAKRANKANDITGVLFFEKSRFLQVIEGNKSDLDSLMHKIYADDRHTQIEILIDEPVDIRGFSEWSMDSFELDSEKPFDNSTLSSLTDKFKSNIKPNSGILVTFYKSLLGKKDLIA